MGDKGEGGVKNFKIWVTSFMDVPLDSSSESDLNADDSCSNSFKDSFILLPTTGQNSGLDRGKGNIAKIFGKSSEIGLEPPTMRFGIAVADP